MEVEPRVGEFWKEGKAGDSWVGEIHKVRDNMYIMEFKFVLDIGKTSIIFLRSITFR
jgi:hypothetical protein